MRRTPSGDQMGVKISNGVIVNATTGVKVRDGIDLESDNVVIVNTKTAYDISGGSIVQAQHLADLRRVIPPETPDDVINDGVKAAAGAIQAGRDPETAIRNSRLWQWVKEVGPDAVALIIQIGNKYLAGS
ncbi:hypothetical protein NUV25_19810 [Burkholderia pseudomultivorans]|uniref:hypothetical protein n=1 Tax=Burkholderia pseudomultivorans TaxID=1207504 RepID=UPI002875E635|nr:hypothetical protein [Burkholderia pseudomultivorans]MDS0859957.1 hypothetical protein [Burkholderia pseudomultivorans]